jgi:hypothetical protein
MFAIQPHESLHIDGQTLAVKGATLESALDFLNKLASPDGIFLGNWTEQNGTYVLKVWHWDDAWVPTAPPLAEIIAPQGWAPPPDSPI